MVGCCPQTPPAGSARLDPDVLLQSRGEQFEKTWLVFFARPKTKFKGPAYLGRELGPGIAARSQEKTKATFNVPSCSSGHFTCSRG